MRTLVSKRLVGRAVGLVLGLLVLVLATPRTASAYVDPGSGAMLWQVAAAACIGSLFYMRRVIMWARGRVDFRSPRAMGFAFATVYGLVVSPLVCSLCRHGHVPRFGDLFLFGIVLTAYCFTWEGAAYLLGVGVLVSAWILPPDRSFAVAATTDLYRIVSFTLVSVFLICLITRVKAGHVSSLVRHGHGAGMGGRALGAD